jgi:hypothetical protein
MNTVECSFRRSKVYYAVGLVAALLAILYLGRVTGLYLAFVNYDRGQYPRLWQQHPAGPDPRARYLKRAVRLHRRNARYTAALGGHLFQSHNSEGRQQNLAEAAHWLKQAILRDPANPSYYYELGRISHDRDACAAADARTECPRARYFRAALHQAPLDYFFRREIGRWFYRYDQEQAFELMRTIIAHTAEAELTAREMTREMARFLYDMHLDYQSDQMLAGLPQSVGGISESAPCTSLTTHTEGIQVDAEFGRDDGHGEWRTPVFSEIMRIQKTLCVPEHLDDYQYAALKILMNNGGNGNFTARVMLDDQEIKRYTPNDPVPRIASWYEIPFDKTLLRGKDAVSVYLRVQGVSNVGNYLQIWGDQDTPTRHSVLNFETTEDLSPHPGVQTGEYLIRLVLKGVVIH